MHQRIRNFKFFTMKSLKTATVILFTLISSISLAGVNCKDKIKNKDIFTAEQIEMKIRHCESLKEPRKAFRATLTAEQKAIRKDKSLAKKVKREKLRTTLSAEQLAIKNEIKARRKQNRAEFIKTLSPEQKATLKKRRKERKVK